MSAPDVRAVVHAALRTVQGSIHHLGLVTLEVLTDRVTEAVSPLVPGATTPTAEPDFFQPGRTYAINDGTDRAPTQSWIFTVEALGREPGEHGRRVAFGYLGNQAGRQATAHIESADSWTRGWTDITEDGQ